MAETASASLSAALPLSPRLNAREYFCGQTYRDSIEWAIPPYYDNDSGVFSKDGDSGLMIASGFGKFGGLLTGGSGRRSRRISHHQGQAPQC
jgi:hypothetical protein